MSRNCRLGAPAPFSTRNVSIEEIGALAPLSLAPYGGGLLTRLERIRQEPHRSHSLKPNQCIMQILHHKALRQTQ